MQQAVGSIEQQQRMLHTAAVRAACRVPMVVPPSMLAGMGGAPLAQRAAESRRVIEQLAAQHAALALELPEAAGGRRGHA